MKTERRHELQHNDLSDALGEGLGHLMPYAKVLLGLVILGAAGLFAAGYLNGRNKQAEQDAWASYYDAVDSGNLEQLNEIIKNYPGTVAAAWSMLSEGDVHLGTGLRELFSDREKAKESLEKARNGYEATLQNAPDDPMLQQRARFGLAQAQEGLGEFDKAKEEYKSITERYKESSVASLAQYRLNQLDRPQMKEWYAWFAEQKPVKSPLNDPSLFQDLPNLPEKPDINVPQPNQALPAAGATSGAVDTTDLPDLTEPQSEPAAEVAPPTQSAVETPPPSDTTTPGPETVPNTPAPETPAPETPATPEVPAPEGSGSTNP